MATYHLYRWSVIGPEPDAFRAPELDYRCLVGFRDQQEKPVRTSSIASVEGRKVTTVSGSVYILEDINPEYLDYINSSGREFDPENPIKIIKHSK